MYYKYYKNYWKKNNINDDINIFLNLLDNNIDYIKYKEKYNWKSLDSKYPLQYIYYNKSNLSYEEFEFKYYTNKFKKSIPHNYIENFYKDHIKIQKILDIYCNLNKLYFISLDILSYINNEINTCKVYYYNVGKESQSLITLYCFYKDDLLNINDLVNNIIIITKWLYNIKLQKNPTYINNITIYYFNIPIKKKIYNINIKYKFLSSKNVNSGLSYMNNNIYIYREEEAYKVLIHELIHALDFFSFENNIISYNIGNISYPIIIDEAITELIAQFLHCLFYIYNKNLLDKFKYLYYLENIFNWYNTVKIFKFYGIKQFDIDEIKEKFNQSSNIYSYYILKSLFCLDFYKFIHILIDYNYNNIVENIKNILNNIPYNFINYIINKTKYKNNSSLRMTCSTKFFTNKSSFII